MAYLPHEADDYRKAIKYFSRLLQNAKEDQERNMVSIALEALHFAALRLENPPLTPEQLRKMHGQPVYCASLYGGESGGGIVDLRHGQIILLDHDGVWRDSIDFFDWAGRDRYFQFPINGVDLLELGGQT